MDLHFPFSFNFTLLIVPFFFIFMFNPFVRICKTLIKTRKSQMELPPGPTKLPLIGNLLHIAGSLPHRALANLAKKHGPIMHLKLGEMSVVVISSSQLAKEALSTNDLALANRPEIQASKIMMYDNKDIVFSPYGEYWRQMRKICMEQLVSVVKVRALWSVLEEEVRCFIESIRKSSGLPIDLTKKIYLLQNVVINRCTVGNQSKDQDALIDIIMATVASGGGFDLFDLFPSFKFLHILLGSSSKLNKMHQQIDQILNNIINEHIKNLGPSPTPEEDLLDVLLRLTESRGLKIPITTSCIKAVLLDIFIGGTDTSSTTIEWAMAEMMKNPRVMEKAQAELRQVIKGKKTIEEADIQECSYLKLVIKETMRLHTPLTLLIARQCREQCEIGGYTIPIKTNLLVNVWAIARDPEHWHDAESFVPERFEGTSYNFNGTNFEYLPFGSGRRMCPGISFGLANVELTLAHLLFNFDWKLPSGMQPEDLDMTEVFGATVRLKNSLYVVATPRTPDYE